jgi:uncharacterized protein
MAAVTHTPRRRRPQERLEEGGRRLQPAGRAIVVALVALVLGALLNAPGIRKSATIQPEGWKRDLALAVTKPLASVSHALLLDRPRKVLKAALGRSDDDQIDTAVAVPEPAHAKPISTKPPPQKRIRVSPAHPLRLWIAGDSLVVVPGESLLRALAGNRAVKPSRKIDGRIATGLERPDVFNWFTAIRDEMRTARPNAVVVMFGGNDDHDFMTGLPEGRTIGQFGSSSWTQEYRRRVRAVMDLVTRQSAYLVWIGLPITHDAAQTSRFDAINTIVQKEAQRRPGRVSYVDTYFFFAGDDGGFAQYVTDDAGRLVKMRADDGVHFERAAGDLIAREVLDRFGKRFDLTSWRQSASR